MRPGVIAGIAAIAMALAIGALLATWEKGPAPNKAGLPDTAMQEGRAAATDPASKGLDYENR
jgi:hypothetical protein